MSGHGDSAPRRTGTGAGRRDAKGRQRSGARLSRDRAQSTLAPSARARQGDAPRTVAFWALRAVSQDDAYANLVLPPMIRRAGLDTRDAALATELTYGTLRWQGLYDAIIGECIDRELTAVDPPVLDALRLGSHQLLATRVPSHAAVSETVALARAQIGSGPAGFVNAVLRKVAARDLDGWREQLMDGAHDATSRLALSHSHPAWIVRALREALLMHGREVSELEALLEANNQAPRVSLVARPGLATPAEFIEAGAEPGRWSPHAATLPAGDPAGLAAVSERRARVQDEGSQLVALALATAGPVAADEQWLDLCAGPGGKTALLAALAADCGARVTAVEPVQHRADLVKAGLRAGEPVEVRVADGRSLDEPGRYHRVLVDAPCTGLGALRRRPESRWRRQPTDLSALAPLQRELLDAAVAATRPGGVIAYATCSPHAAETVLVIEDAQRRHNLTLLDAPATMRAVAEQSGLSGVGDGPMAQLWPHLHGTDAMFLALLRTPG